MLKKVTCLFAIVIHFPVVVNGVNFFKVFVLKNGVNKATNMWLASLSKYAFSLCFFNMDHLVVITRGIILFLSVKLIT